MGEIPISYYTLCIRRNALSYNHILVNEYKKQLFYFYDAVSYFYWIVQDDLKDIKFC
jgi:hypothetical protein